MPAGRPIYFSCDFDAQPSQQAAINAYMDGVASVIGRSRTGAYGGYGVPTAAIEPGEISPGFEMYELEESARSVPLLTAMASRWFRGLGDVSLTKVSRGLITMTPDHLPLIGPLGGLDDVLVASVGNVHHDHSLVDDDHARRHRGLAADHHEHDGYRVIRLASAIAPRTPARSPSSGGTT